MTWSPVPRDRQGTWTFITLECGCIRAFKGDRLHILRWDQTISCKACRAYRHVRNAGLIQ